MSVTTERFYYIVKKNKETKLWEKVTLEDTSLVDVRKELFKLRGKKKETALKSNYRVVELTVSSSTMVMAD